MFGVVAFRHTWRVGVLVAALALIVLAALPNTDEAAAIDGGVVQITGGLVYTCALLEDSGVQCWGENEAGQLGDGTTNDSETPVDVCASGAGAGCSGGSQLTGAVHVSAGVGGHTCAVMEDGGVQCWGSNSVGQLGIGNVGGDYLNPVDVCESGIGAGCSGGAPLDGAVEVSVGSGSSCALMEDTTIRCWGTNDSGALGIGDADPGAGVHPQTVCSVAAVPAPLAPAGAVCSAVTGFLTVDSGHGTTCAVTNAGGVKCWGRGEDGLLGNGSDANHTSPVDVCVFDIVVGPLAAGAACIPVSGAVDVSVGERHACAVNDNTRLRCWGNNEWGKLGDGTGEAQFNPVGVCASGAGADCDGGERLNGVQSVVSGSAHTCAIVLEGDIECWGQNAFGALGDTTTTDRSHPVSVSGFASGAVSLAAGRYHSCGAAEDGTVQCWGSNEFGQLGFDAFEDCNMVLCSTVARNVNFGPKVPNAPAAPGDVDCSGGVTAIDAAFLLQLLAGLIDELPCAENADVNGDGNVNAVDAALILQYSAGLINSLPP